MKTYLFETTTTMKPYNSKNYWIDSNMIPRQTIFENSVQAALISYVIKIENYGINISNTAIKNKQPMYIDTYNGDSKQVGYVITGKTEISKEDYSTTTQYVNLWIRILTITETEF